MPKATKKSKIKQADFQKAKLKLGKGKKAPSNATDTSFKARSIALPGQGTINRALADTTEKTTAGGLGLDDVLLRFRHPNSGVRKEAIGGLKDILTGDSERQVGKVVRALGGLVSDEEASVRKALINFVGWYLASVRDTILVPHLPLFLLQTSSALSHIFPEIRLDACRLVALLLTHVPSQITAGWPQTQASLPSSSKSTLDRGNNILEGLRLAVGLGGEPGATASMGKIGASGRLVTLRTLLDFVQNALGRNIAEKSRFQGWIEQNGKGKGKAVDVNVSAAMVVPDGWLVGAGPWGVEQVGEPWELSCLGAGVLDDQQGTTNVLTLLYTSLVPLVQSTFLENAPTAFSPSSAPASTLETAIALCLTSTLLTETLATPILLANPKDKAVAEAVSDYVRRMAPYFPFKEVAGISLSPDGLSPALELNLAYSNLAILLAPPVPFLALKKVGQKQVGWREKVKATEEAWRTMRASSASSKRGSDDLAMGKVAEWIESALSPSTDILSPQLTRTSYTALLDLVWPLVDLEPYQTTNHNSSTQSILTTFLTHLLRQSSTSQIRSAGDAFLISLVKIHEQPYPRLPFYVDPASPDGLKSRELILRWVSDLPRAIWEIGGKSGHVEELLAFLLEIAQRGKSAFVAPCSLLSDLPWSQIALKLGTFFHLQHPERKSRLGPWIRLSSESARRLALNVAIAWSAYDETGALRNAVGHAVAATGWEKEYWTSRQ